MNLISIFEQFSLKEEHLKIYLANLERGESSISKLAVKSDVPRTTIYSLIEDLINVGLITKTMKGGSSNYIANDPEVLAILLEKRQKEIAQSLKSVNDNLSELKSMQNKKSNKPKIEFLEGSEGIKQAYNMTFDAKEIWIQCLAENYEEVVKGKFFEEYFDKFFKKSNIRSKEILKLEDEDYVSSYRSDKNLQLRVPAVSGSETDVMVYENKVIFVSFNKERPYALVITDKDIAASIKNIYQLAWKEAKREDPEIKKGRNLKTEF